jgi:hypothetical protein
MENEEKEQENTQIARAEVRVAEVGEVVGMPHDIGCVD